MSLKTPAIPPVVMRAFTAGLGNYVDPSTPLWSLLLKDYLALEWRSLSLSKVEKLDGPEFKKPVNLVDLVIPSGWRFLAADGKLYGGCHVGNIRTDSPPIHTGFSTDEQILTFMERWTELKAMPVVASGEFELRVLRITWLHFEAFWLHTEDGDGDIVIPYIGFVRGAPNQLEMMKPYPVLDFLAAIWPRVLQVSAEANTRKALDQKAKADAALAHADIACVSATARARTANAQRAEAEALAQKANTQRAAFAALTPKASNQSAGPEPSSQPTPATPAPAKAALVKKPTPSKRARR